MLTEDQISSFQTIYQRTYGHEIPREHAERLASHLILFMEATIKP